MDNQHRYRQRSRTRSMVLWFMMIATMLLLLQPSLSSSAELEVMATMTPESFSVDSGARLTVTVNGSRSADLELPETDPAKYEIFQRGRSSQINIVNGDISAAITFTCIVRAYTPGHYTLPPIIVSADGQSRQTAPLPFTVTGSQPPPQSGAGAGPGKGVEPPSQKSRNSEEIAFLTLELDREDGYVGEIIPVTVKAYFRKGLRAQLNAAPTLVGDGGLIMPQLNEKPVQTEENAGKTRYAVLTWQTALSNIKEGEHTVQLELDATLLIPDRRGSTSMFGQSPFADDDFFNNFFGRYREKPITVRSAPLTFLSQPLPEKGRPVGFTGAIGDFNLQVSAAPAEAEVGEPITLTMTISGTGNFDRVQEPPFPRTEGWKTYSPSAEFHPSSTSHQTGRKVFEQAIVAKTSHNEIPSLSFSYFDPEEKRYITRESMPIPAHITDPAPQMTAAMPAPAPPQLTGSGVKESEQQGTPKHPGLAPLHLEAGDSVAAITPLFLRPPFLLFCVVLGLVLVSLTLLHIKRRHHLAHPEIEVARKRDRELQSAIESLEAACRAGDSAEFLACCRTTIQYQLASSWMMSAEAITRADLQEKIGSEHPLTTLFTRTEEAAYSGAPLDQKSMENGLAILKTELTKLS